MSDSVYVKDDQAPVAQRIVLARWEKWLAGAGAALAVGVSTIGLVASYKAVEAKAALPAAEGGWGWEEPWMLPVAVDLAILAFSIVNLLLIRWEREAAWVKWVPRALTGLTIWLNWQAGASGTAAAGHAGLAALWVVFSEIAAHLYAGHIGRLRGRVRMDGIRPSRWLLSPIATAQIARQMKLWEITSYTQALELEKSRQVYAELLTQRHGKKWRRKASRPELMPITLAKFGVTVEDALSEPARRAEKDALRKHEAEVRTRALALRMAEEEATEALAAVERQAAIDSAKARAEAERLLAEAERIRAEQEARTAADAVVRNHELALQLQQAKADAEADRLRAEAAAEAARATAQAEAEAAEIRARAEEAQLKAQIERDKLERQATEDARLAELETNRRQAEAAAEQARLAKAKAEAEQAAAEATRKKAEAERQAAVALEAASVTRAKAVVTEAEAERRAAEDKRLAALAEAEAAELEKAMAVALEAAAVAHESATRSPAERQALIVADLIEKFGEEKVTLSYIERALGVTGGTRQDRRDRARQILADRRNQAAGGRDDMPNAA
ncbi:DUF2637 domain-containing protein [Streptomyces sp. SP17BM10]|uniref:DUF2637 domain-containing protein n=1 Tax=Streptomyces sp. SP17BM10 TaxID=3002530 RepID=UPI002E75F9F6|nr:DUF2637 domain-containing protein [Streptomyces sp. SP17BM10]MEE1783048.1 DUF2637 domain-containing protein [Streptomyces sp. SP17BM10]